jgi:hypothetical protein
MPLAVASAMRFSFGGHHREDQYSPMHPPIEFRLRLGHCPAKPSLPRRNRTGSSHGLCSPSAHQESKVHVARAKACPLGPVLRVWLPSRRFTPFDSLPALFRAGGARGVHPSELPPHGRLAERYRSDGPTYRFVSRFSRCRGNGTARKAAVSGFSPFREFLAAGRVFSTTTAGCSLGFDPSRARGRRPSPGFRRKPSRTLRRFGRETHPEQPASRSIDQPPLDPIPNGVERRKG